MPKKKVKKPAVRRDPYARALETAQKRLDKAMLERDHCISRLTALAKEIPHLQNIITALQREPLPVRHVEATIPIPDSVFSGLKYEGKAVVDGLVPAHLDRFMHPRPIENTQQEIETEDDTLSESLQGEEILP